MPATSTAADQLWPSSTEAEVSGDAFLSTFVEQMSDARAAVNLRVSPYSRNTTDGVTYRLDEVCFTQSELLSLRQNLLDAGAPESTLSTYDSLCQQPGGATLAQVQESLHNQNQNAEPLTDEERDDLGDLLDGIDDSGALRSQVLSLMDQGKGLEAWQSITQALSSASSLSVRKEDALLLAKGLGISTQGQALLDASFGSSGMLRLTGQGLAQFMQSATAELDLQAAQRSKLEAALDKTLKPLITTARDRMQKEEAAASSSSRQNDRSQIRIEQRAKQKGHDALESLLSEEDTSGGSTNAAVITNDTTGAAKNTEGSAKHDALSAAKNAADAMKHDASSDMAKNAADTTSHNMMRAETEQTLADGYRQGQSKQQGQQNAGQSGKEDILSDKIRTQHSKHTVTDIRSAVDMAFANRELSSSASVSSNASGKTAGASSYLSAKAAAQVESGVLSAMRDGSNRLSLQLNPLELGNITLTLTARNGEISASIRSEKTETAEMLQAQLDVIRTNLEQQGIKVDSLEVRQEDSGSESNAWQQDVNQHNNWQEEDSRRQANQRFRTLATLRNADDSASSTILAQPVHSDTQTARYAGQSLHIVA